MMFSNFSSTKMLNFESASCCLWRLSELRTISNPLAVGPSDRRVERLLKAINLQPSLSAALNRSTTTPGFLAKAGNFAVTVSESFSLLGLCAREQSLTV